MTKLQWCVDIQEILVRSQMYWAANKFRESANVLVNENLSEEVMTLEFYNKFIMKLKSDKEDLRVNDMNWGAEKIIAEASSPYLREDKINKITNK